jgi:uncharacterized membrane protein YvbJ
MSSERCPLCGVEIERTATVCPNCGKGLTGRALLSAYELQQQQQRGASPPRTVAKVFWVITLLAVPLAVFVGYVGVVQANGAPQEAAAAAIACAICIAPYVFARAVDELIR